MDRDPGKPIKISRLARLADVSVSTIKHYVHAGLLPKPVKTGKTMAYYDAGCVERIQQIKQLQREKFLPLDVIRRILDRGSSGAGDVEAGRVMVPSHKLDPSKPPVPRAQIEQRTGCPTAKIDLLEKAGLIDPARIDGQKSYDAIDCQIIELVKKREKIGVSLEYSLETMRFYRDAVERAVEEDVRRFARDLLGDLTAREAVRLMTEADDSLDHFMVLIRQKILRSISQRAVKQTSDLARQLGKLNFLPVPGRDLPVRAPGNAGYRVIHDLCRGDYAAVVALERDRKEVRGRPRFVAVSVVARLLMGEVSEARSLVNRWFPEPTARPVENCAAALACVYSGMEASGLTDPIYYLKKAAGYLKRVEGSCREGGVMGCIQRYVCGALSLSLPDLFDTGATGLSMLRELEPVLRTGEVYAGGLPEWWRLTLTHEMLPAMEIRVNRFLAEGGLRFGDRDTARGALARLTEIDGPEGEDGRWARREQLRTKKKKEDA